MATITACDPCAKNGATSLAIMKVPAVTFTGEEITGLDVSPDDFKIEMVDACGDHGTKILKTLHTVALTITDESGYEEALGLKPQPVEETAGTGQEDDGQEDGSEADTDDQEDGEKEAAPSVDDLPGLDDDDEDDESLAALNNARQAKKSQATAPAKKTRAKSTTGYAAKYSDEEKLVIRTWAQKKRMKPNGKPVADKGRIADAVYVAFEEAGSPGL